jgi:two-component system sensor histidine kinase KdpD
VSAPPGPRAARVTHWILWLGVLAIVTGLMLAARAQLDKTHVTLVYLLVVLGGSAMGGRALGLTLAAAAFVLFGFAFVPPYYRFRVADPLDWIVLVAFLVTGIVAAELLERQRRESEVVRARTAEIGLRDALIASVSHDLRTPLTTIKGLANEIARGGDPDQAHVIEEEADRLTSLVNDLLDLSRLAVGEMPVHLALNTADDVIGAALQRVEPAFPDRIVATTLAEPWTDLIGRFDFVHTMRILTNLLENAAKYAPAGTPIRLRAWREGAELHFAVEDAGAGVAPQDRERVFAPFVRARASSPGVKGTGLGLSIARRLAEVQGGRLSYEPSATVQSRFVLSVPAAETPPLQDTAQSL